MARRAIVVGAGIMGTSTAYYLAKLGLDVELIEAKDIAAGTSGACDQHVLLQTKQPGPVLDLALESRKLYEHLEEELEADFEFCSGGGMILIQSEEEYDLMKKRVEQQKEGGLNVTMLSQSEVHQKQQGLSRHLIASTWCPDDAHVNVFKVCFQMAKAAMRLGAKLRLQSPVERLLVEQGRIVGVETNGENIYADVVVLATGVWTPQLLKPFDIEVPIIPRKGQVLVSEKVTPFIQKNILSADYIVAKSITTADSKVENPAGVGFVIEQTMSGNLLIGASREFVGFNRDTDIDVIQAIQREAIKFMPSLKHVRIIRTYAGLRPSTPDGKPIIGPIDAVKGLYIVAGHEGDGIALAPISGKMIAQMISEKKLSLRMDPFSFSRFS